MRRPYLLHGRRHSPDGSDPAYTGARQMLAAPSEAWTAWDSSTSYSVGDQVSDSTSPRDEPTFNFQAIRANTNVDPYLFDGPASANWSWRASIIQPGFLRGSEELPPGFRLIVGPPGAGDYRSHLHLFGCMANDGSVDSAILMFLLPPDYEPYLPQRTIALAYTDDIRGPTATLELSSADFIGVYASYFDGTAIGSTNDPPGADVWLNHVF